MRVMTLRQKRQQATRWFLMRCGLLVMLAGGIAYAAWFADWAKPVRQVTTEEAK